MKRTEIKVSRPEHTLIYAVGGAALTNEHIWDDPVKNYVARSYTPAYVLEVDRSGVLVLYALNHPEAEQAVRNKQASLLEGAGYSLDDYRERQALLEQASHWAEAERPQDLKDALTKLKQVPRGWRVDRIEATHVRMLWAEYALKLQEKADFRAYVAAQKDEKKQADKVRFSRVLDGLRTLKVIDGKEGMEVLEKYQFRDREKLEMPIEVWEQLVDIALAQKPARRKASA